MANNIHNPYIGLRAYEEADATLFRGRKTATADLFRMISENDVVVLHAESGEGKSSLLNAGLSPMLRDERYFPIKINFMEEDFAIGTPDFNDIIFNRIKNEINKINKDLGNADVFSEKPIADGKISFIPISSVGYDINKFNFFRQNTWWLLRNYVLNAYGADLTPVLVFDQFEEVFTRPKNISWTDAFFLWLSTNLSDEIPAEIVTKVRNYIGIEAPFPNISTSKHFKALFSQRTEYIGELDYWAIQRHQIPVLKNSRFCLKPLTEDEAEEVLGLQSAFKDGIREEIKRSICATKCSGHDSSNLPTIPAMLLSVVCTTVSSDFRDYNIETFVKSTQNSLEKDSKNYFDNIIKQFYEREIHKLSIPPSALSLIEFALVDDKGERVRIKSNTKELRSIGFEDKYIKLLENGRLIKITHINGSKYVELVHDALARVIARQREETLNQTLHKSLIDTKKRSLTCTLLIYFCIIGYTMWYLLLKLNTIISALLDNDAYDGLCNTFVLEGHRIKTILIGQIICFVISIYIYLFHIPYELYGYISDSKRISPILLWMTLAVFMWLFIYYGVEIVNRTVALF